MNLKEFFSNPWVGGIGSIASVAGLFLAVYFYVDGRQSRHLEVNVNPAKATVVKSGQSSKLSVSYDSQPISTDITAAQIEIWNAGNLPIKAENVLQPLVITTEGVAILEASVTKVSRAVTMVALDSSEAQKGRLRVSWGIFERSDGAVIQVTYAGKPDTNITA